MSEEDKTLFRQMMRDVKPLKGKTVRASQPRPEPVLKRRGHHVPEQTADEVYLSDHYNDPILPDTVLSYRDPSVSVKRFAQFKQGRFACKRLDLHGLSVTDAQQALKQFIISHYQAANRTLLIIHGKGAYQVECSILKSFVNHWLKQLPQVLAFHSALPKDGGKGAVYVLLKNQTRALYLSS